MLKENEQSSLTLINSNFENNFAQAEGGVLKIINIMVSITNSTFNANMANIGGVISYQCDQNCSSCGLEAKFNIFKDNKGNKMSYICNFWNLRLF